MLESGQILSEKDVYPFAENNRTRELAFQLLEERGQSNLFPKEYYSFIKAAESRLVNWLEFPTELDACPDAEWYEENDVVASATSGLETIFINSKGEVVKR